MNACSACMNRSNCGPAPWRANRWVFAEHIATEYNLRKDSRDLTKLEHYNMPSAWSPVYYRDSYTPSTVSQRRWSNASRECEDAAVTHPVCSITYPMISSSSISCCSQAWVGLVFKALKRKMSAHHLRVLVRVQPTAVIHEPEALRVHAFDFCDVVDELGERRGRFDFESQVVGSFLSLHESRGSSATLCQPHGRMGCSPQELPNAQGVSFIEQFGSSEQHIDAHRTVS